MYEYIKALHIVFVVTWFSGLFYIVRLFIYNTEAYEKAEPERGILLQQFGIMIKRLWLGITWPSALLTLIFGPYMWLKVWYSATQLAPTWLLVKLGFVLALYAYHMSLHVIYKQQAKGIFKYSSNQLRIWNEVATVFLIAIVMLAVVKQSMSWLYGLCGLLLLMVVLMSAIRIYKIVRNKKS